MRPVKARSTTSPLRLDRQDVADLARGCAFLGSGGGGDPHSAFLEIDAMLANGGTIDLIDAAALDARTFVAGCGWMYVRPQIQTSRFMVWNPLKLELTPPSLTQLRHDEAHGDAQGLWHSGQ